MTDGVFARRAIVGFGASAAVTGLAGSARSEPARAIAGAEGVWRPTFEPQDSWLDRAGARHRLVLDAASAAAAASAVFFADNFYLANRTAYGLPSDSLGVVIILRHFATPYGYDDGVWAKYGSLLAATLGLTGAAAAAAAHVNPGNLAGPKVKPTDDEVTLATLAKKGAMFAICGLATEYLGGVISAKTGQKPEAVAAELKGRLIPGGINVPAGIVAVNRAQEHGYAYVAVA